MTVLALGALAASVGAGAAAMGPLPTSTSLQPSRVLFADPIIAVATVAVDRAAIDPATVRAVAAFGALDVLAGPTVERTDRGADVELQFRWEMACLSQECAPASTTARRLRLPPLRVKATNRDGRALHTMARWPALSIAGRVTAEEADAAIPPFRLETDLPRATYRIAPRALETALDVVAALLAAAVLLLAARELRAYRRRRERERLDLLSPLERALLFAREAARRGPADRRKALSLLARVLGGSGNRLGGAASELAWAPPEPSPAELASVVDEVEREVGLR